MVRRHRQKKIHDGQRNIRQICEFGQLMSDQDRETTGMKLAIQIQTHLV